MIAATRNMTVVCCDLCGGDRHKVLFEKEGYYHVRCLDCGMVFVNPRLGDHLELQETSGTGSMGEDSLTPAQIRRLEKELKIYEPFRALNRLLEVGVGRGWFLDVATKNGWETWAVEINLSALDCLTLRKPHRLLVQPAEEFHAEPESVDAVRMWDVIEHLRSPRAAVSRIFRVLRPGGFVRLSTTNFDSLSRMVNGPQWVYLNGSDHIHLFEPPTITRLLAEVGFRDVKIRTRSFNLRKKLYHPEKELPIGPLWLTPFRKIIDATIGFTRFGHQMIVTGLKPGV